MLLGDDSQENVRFRQPGAYHLARWMAKAIYCIKIFLFRHQFHTKATESQKIKDLRLFIVFCYSEAWFSAADSIKAPVNDIYFLRKLNDLKEINPELAEVAINKFINHLWYLNEECVAFSIFNVEIKAEERRQMAKKILEKGDEDEEELETNKKLPLRREGLADFIKKDLPLALFSPKSKTLFKRFCISTDLLETDPDKWEESEDFLEGQKVISSLKSVDDVAERGVKLMEEYNDKFTRNENQKQFLLQVCTLNV